MNIYKYLLILIGLQGLSGALSAKNIEAEITLKNLYADRQYDHFQPALGSWSQGVMVKAKAKQEITDDVDALFTASLQYAQRLSSSKHNNDMILPFDSVSKKQAEHYKKVAGSIGLKYQDHQISWGEQWLNTPLATNDFSRQLITIYDGVVYKGKFSDQLNLELARINRFSPRNEDGFRKLSVRKVNTEGLNYINANFIPDFIPEQKLKLNLYYGNLIDLYDQVSLGLSFQQPVSDFLFKSKFRFYSSQQSGSHKLGNIDNQYYGFLQEVKYGYNTFGLGYQKFTGPSDFPTLDGYVPVLDYVNWTQGAFNRAHEQSYHFTFNHNFEWIIPNLSLTVKYVRGSDFSTKQRQDAKESEVNSLLNYNVKEGRFKGFDFKWVNIIYDNNDRGGYSENRLISSYTHKF